jgi:hypothetical protein
MRSIQEILAAFSKKVREINMLKRTPILALFIACVIAAAVVYFIEIPARSFTYRQLILLYILSYCVALGIALYFDPIAAETKKKYLKINFYEEK